jgi:hypothetical protein
MAKARSRNRIVLHLNTRMALEAIILNRLESIPQARRQEWLRGLLVQGFRDECQVMRQGTDTGQAERRMNYSGWLAADSTIQNCKPIKQVKKVISQRETKGIATKPFAALSRIIG